MTAVMLAIFVTMVVIAWDYPPKSRFLPLVIGVPGIVLTLVQLFLDVRHSLQTRRSKTRASGSVFQNVQAALSRRLGRRVDLDIAREELTAVVKDRSDQGTSQLHRELVLFGYFVGLVAGVILFGFWLTVPVFLIVFLRVHERDNWMFAVSLTAAAWLVIYLIFDQLLEIALHTGFVTEYLIALLPE
jgi:hypothetical protein